MSTGKVSFKLGAMEFVGEGSETWVASQLDKILQKAAEIKVPAEPKVPNVSAANNGKQFSANGTTLAKFLQDHKATTNQTQRFLATAAWLIGRGQTSVSSGDVAKALKDNHQNRLSNASDCLNKNVGKGFCEKDGKQFFLTPEGLAQLGMN